MFSLANTGLIACLLKNAKILTSEAYRNSSLKLFQLLRTKALSQKRLSYLGPLIWNGLSDDVKVSNNVNTFKHKVKKNFLTLLREKNQDIYV